MSITKKQSCNYHERSDIIQVVWPGEILKNISLKQNISALND